VTSRAEGAVYKINDDDEAISFASDMAIATGIAFDKNGQMFVGDRSGNIFRVSDAGYADVFATLEPSIAAYHLAFGADGERRRCLVKPKNRGNDSASCERNFVSDCAG